MTDQPAPPEPAPSLEYQRSRFDRAQKHAVGGLMLMGLFLAGSGVLLMLLVLGVAIADALTLDAFLSAAAPLVVSAVSLSLGAAMLVCAFHIRRGSRAAAGVAIALVATLGLALAGLFAAGAIINLGSEYGAGPIALWLIVLGLLVGVGFGAIVFELVLVRRHGVGAVLE